MKMIFLLRHADVDPPPGPTPDNWPLNPAGRERSQLLARTIGLAGVSAIYVSAASRTRETAKPLAQQLALPLKPTPPLSQVREKLDAEPGEVILVVGHSNSVPEIMEVMGVPPPLPVITGHDDLFLVCRGDQSETISVHLKYGQPTP
jgi:phosphohistidine phosphatase SixA